MAINTPFGLTEREEYDELVQQGGSWGAICCSNSLDKLGRNSYENEENLDKLYKYKGLTPVPQMSYIDDLMEVSKCGIESLESNIKTTKQID